jgi:DNA polymerase III subunit delta'
VTFLGQDAQESAFLAAMHSERLHHAWLLTGPQGIGKAGFAAKAAARMLAVASAIPPTGEGMGVPETHATAKLIDAGSHPDLYRLQRLEKEKTGDVARSITIEQVRQLTAQFSLAPSQGNRRVVIIDAIEDLERNAANALLKSLEEPPASTVFLLVSHAPDRLLPTIRSRCRTLRFGRLDQDSMKVALRRVLPDAGPIEIDSLARIGDGVPGLALRFAGLDIAAIDSALSDLATKGDPDNAQRYALAVQLSGKSAQPRYEAFLARAPAFLAGQAKERTGLALDRALNQWDVARTLADSAVHQSLDPHMVVFALASHVAALAPGAAAAKA